jgi:hypothetical protein
MISNDKMRYLGSSVKRNNVTVQQAAKSSEKRIYASGAIPKERIGPLVVIRKNLPNNARLIELKNPVS